ncbi:MAG: hypothetical protein M4579_001866 [Chaenotheca gracillima]|nr:MAG: hypothetical protein M4579_001866 [Chaenotheca gracillima]
MAMEQPISRIEQPLPISTPRGREAEHEISKGRASKWNRDAEDFSPERRFQPTSRQPGYPKDGLDRIYRRQPHFTPANFTRRKAGVETRKEILAEQASASDDSASGASDRRASLEEPEGPNRTRAPDADITYSFDEPKGPQKGSQILGMALAQAVERFEGRETEKLVREEYDLVVDAAADDDDYVPKASGRGREKKIKPVAVDEDGFELV